MNIKDNPRERMQAAHARSLGVLAEMQRTFKPGHTSKVVEYLTARVNRQIAESDVVAKEVKKNRGGE